MAAATPQSTHASNIGRPCQNPVEAMNAVDQLCLITLVKAGDTDALDELLWAFFPSITPLLESTGHFGLDLQVFTTLRRRLRRIVQSKPDSLEWTNGKQAWRYLKNALIRIAWDCEKRTVRISTSDIETLSKHGNGRSSIDLSTDTANPSSSSPDEEGRGLLRDALNSISEALNNPILSRAEVNQLAHLHLEEVLVAETGSAILNALCRESAVNIVVILARAEHPDWTEEERQAEYLPNRSVNSVRIRASRTIARARTTLLALL